MRKRFIIISLAFIVCFTTKAQVLRGVAQTDTLTSYLLTSSAADFDHHRPPNPVGFRKVKLGHIKSADGGKQYLLSGEFLTKEDKKEDLSAALQSRLTALHKN